MTCLISGNAMRISFSIPNWRVIALDGQPLQAPWKRMKATPSSSLTLTSST
jgi:hypothetical protein